MKLVKQYSTKGQYTKEKIKNKEISQEELLRLKNDVRGIENIVDASINNIPINKAPTTKTTKPLAKDRFKEVTPIEETVHKEILKDMGVQNVYPSLLQSGEQGYVGFKPNGQRVEVPLSVFTMESKPSKPTKPEVQPIVTLEESRIAPIQTVAERDGF